MSRADPSPVWFRKCFNEDYRTIYCGRDKAQAEAEVGFVVQELGIEPGEVVLDLCCGFGRHLEAFEKRGIRAIGVDLSLPLLKQVEPAAERRVACSDMRQLPFAGGVNGFAALVNFFTSFGYFEDDEENSLAARELGRVLRPGGRFSVDLMNPGPAVRLLAPRSERRAGPLHVVEERRYDAARRRIEKRVALRRQLAGGSTELREYFESVRLFSAEEIVSILAGAGLEVTRMFGDFCGRPYGEESARMIVLGRKPEL
jgi:SAM-dependent methyltransferase